MSAMLRIFEVLLTTTPVVSTKMKYEKSTSFMRPNVTVLEPHSISVLPEATAENRELTVTGTHSTLRLSRPSCFWMELTTRLQRSIE